MLHGQSTLNLEALPPGKAIKMFISSASSLLASAASTSFVVFVIPTFSGDNKYVVSCRIFFRVFSCPALCVVVADRARGRKKTLKIPFIFKQRPRMQPPRMTSREEGTSRLSILRAASHYHFRVLQDGRLQGAKGNRGRLEV